MATKKPRVVDTGRLVKAANDFSKLHNTDLTLPDGRADKERAEDVYMSIIEEQVKAYNAAKAARTAKASN